MRQRFEFWTVDLIQGFLEKWLEDLDRGCDGDELWSSCPIIIHERPIVDGCR